MDREKNCFERGVKEAVWVKKSPSLNYTGGTKITLSNFLDRSINTLPVVPTITTTLKNTSGTSRTVGFFSG